MQSQNVSIFFFFITLNYTKTKTTPKLIKKSEP